jgi:hypothetical protein
VSEASTEPPSTSLAQLSYNAALRALDGQERGLEELRARTGTLLAAASLVASFLGAQTIQRTNAPETIEALALLALAVSVGACTYNRGTVGSASPTPPPAPPAPPPDLGHPETKGGLGPLTR